MEELYNIVKVDITTGEVLKNNLLAFWRTQARGDDMPGAVAYSAWHDLSGPKTETLIAERVKDYNSNRRRQNKNSWTDAELYQLAVLIDLQKQKYHQAAAQLAKTTGACRQAFRKMKNAGVI